MKKNILYAMLAVGLMASCSKDSCVDAPDSDGNSGAEAMPIMISAAPTAVSVGAGTRSVGSVGADGGSIQNQWNGQTLAMFCFPKNISPEATVITAEVVADNKCPFFNKLATAVKASASGIITWTDKAPVYFPRNGAYDFFGYHSDGAVKNAPTYSTIGGLPVYAADFEIDGSQDLLYAKAVLTNAQKTTLGVDASKAYSSYTARRDIQPNMTFNHLLTRFTFALVAAKKGQVAASGADEVYIRSIKITSKNTGKFIVVSNNRVANPLEWNTPAGQYPAAYPKLDLKERTTDKSGMKALSIGDQTQLYIKAGGVYTYAKKSSIPGGSLVNWLGKYPASLDNGTVIGESLLVAPDDKYTIEVEVMQFYDGDGNMILPPTNVGDWYVENKDQRYYKFKREITAADVIPSSGDKPTTFAASTSYNVSITMYGLQEVRLNADLVDWKVGGNIYWTPEDDDFLNNNK